MVPGCGIRDMVRCGRGSHGDIAMRSGQVHRGAKAERHNGMMTTSCRTHNTCHSVSRVHSARAFNEFLHGPTERMMTMIDVRQLPLRGADNVRDLGGLSTRDGRRTRDGRLIRSASVQGLTELDIEWLVERIGVRMIVDLRLPEEAERQALGSLVLRVGAYANLPVRTAGMVSADVIPGAVEVDLLTQYIGFLEASGPEIVAAVRLLADPSNQPALFHCAAGKDRTGVLAALLLDAVGVEEEAIVADYALSEAHMDRVIARLCRVSWYREALSRLPAGVHLAEPETMRRFLRHLHAVHGGAARWLTERGLEPTTLDALRWSLVGSVDDHDDLPVVMEGSR